MSCVNINIPEFKALAEASGLNPYILAAKVGVWQEDNNSTAIPSLLELSIEPKVKSDIIDTPVIKEGVSELFKENPELANIGTQEQYSQYLDTIFPDSILKDIVYRGAEKNIENHKAYSHWTLRKTLAENFAKQGVNLNKKDESKNTVYFALLNIKNLIRSIKITDENLKDKGFDSAASFPNQQKPDGEYYDDEEANESIQLIDKNLNNEITVFSPEQIHILGSKKDMQGFKEFVNSQITNNNQNFRNIVDDNFADWASEDNESEDPFMC